MKTHLKTIGVLLALITLGVIGATFPIQLAVFVLLIVVVMVYNIVYEFIKENEDKDDEELSGPFNAGGRERD